MATQPVVTLTYAQSVDGRIATAGGESKWISGDETLTLAHELRRDNGAILVGVGTVLRDDPELTCRLPNSRSPLRVILDSGLRLPLASRIATTARSVPTIAFADSGRDLGDAETRLGTAGIEVVRVPSDGVAGLSLPAVLDELAARGVASVMVEGGARVITAFLRAGLVDHLVVVSAPIVIGRGTEAVGDLGTARLGDALRGRTVSVRQLGQDVVWHISFLDGEVE